MRQEETVKIKIDERTDREFTVYEVRPRDLLGKILNDEKGLDVSFRELMAAEVLPLLTTATLADLEEMFPSDVERLYDALMRVNAPLSRGLRATGKVDLGPVWEIIKSSIVNDLVGFAAGLLKRDTPGASTTGGVSSSTPSTSMPAPKTAAPRP